MPIIIDTADTLPYDYPALLNMVQTWMARIDSKFTGNVANFIRLAEERIWRTLRTDKMLQPFSITIQAGSNSAPVPADWMAFKTVKTPKPAGDFGVLTYVSPEALDDLPAQPGDQRLYTLIGQNFVLGRVEAADTVVSGFYYARPIQLAASQVNWLITDNPSVYLYGALLEASIFVKNPDLAGQFGTLYDRAVASVTSADRAARYGAGRLILNRVGGYRSPGRR